MEQEAFFDEEKKEISEGLSSVSLLDEIEDKPQDRVLSINITDDFTPGELSSYDPDGFFNSGIRAIARTEEKRGDIIIESKSKEESRGHRIYLACMRMNPKDFDYANITDYDVDLMIMAYDYLQDSRPFLNLYQYLIENTNLGIPGTPTLKVSNNRMEILKLGRHNKIFGACLPIGYLNLTREEQEQRVRFLSTEIFVNQRLTDAILDQLISSNDLLENIFYNRVEYTPAEIKYITLNNNNNIKLVFGEAIRNNHAYCLDQLIALRGPGEPLYGPHTMFTCCANGAIDSVKWFMKKGLYSSPNELRSLLRESAAYPSLMNFLLSEISKTPDDGKDYLVSAIKNASTYGHLESLNILLGKYGDVDLKFLKELLLITSVINSSAINENTISRVLELIEPYREEKEGTNKNLYYDSLESAAHEGGEGAFLLIMKEVMKKPDDSISQEDINALVGELASGIMIESIDYMIEAGLVTPIYYAIIIGDILEYKPEGTIFLAKKYLDLWKPNDKEVLPTVLSNYFADDVERQNSYTFESLAELFQLDKEEYYVPSLKLTMINNPRMIRSVISIGQMKERSVLDSAVHVLKESGLTTAIITEIIKSGVITNPDLYTDLISKIEESDMKDSDKVDVTALINDAILEL